MQTIQAHSRQHSSDLCNSTLGDNKQVRHRRQLSGNLPRLEVQLSIQMGVLQPLDHSVRPTQVRLLVPQPLVDSDPLSTSHPLPPLLSVPLGQRLPLLLTPNQLQTLSILMGLGLLPHLPLHKWQATTSLSTLRWISSNSFPSQGRITWMRTRSHLSLPICVSYVVHRHWRMCSRGYCWTSFPRELTPIRGPSSLGTFVRVITSKIKLPTLTVPWTNQLCRELSYKIQTRKTSIQCRLTLWRNFLLARRPSRTPRRR